MKLKHKKLVKNLVIASILLALILILSFIKRVPFIAENIFSRGISRGYICVVSQITAFFPFSVFEILCGVAIILSIISIVRWVRLVKKGKYLIVAKGISKALITVFVVLLVYTATASFSYYRQPLEREVPQHQQKIEKEEILTIVQFFVDDLNNLTKSFERDEKGNIIPPHSFNELSEKLREEYKKLDKNSYFSTYTPKAKKIIASDIMSLFGIIGVSFQPTGESNINTNTPKIHLPQLMAHEFAHSKGVMRESDAELLAAYITLTSDDDYIRYSGYASYLGQILQMLTLNDMSKEGDEVYQNIDKAFLKELNNARQEYAKYRTFINDIGTFFNDIYLKLSGVEDGTDSYYVPGKIVEVPDAGGDIVREIYYSSIQKLIQGIYFEG